MNACSLIRNISGELFREYFDKGYIEELPHDPGDILVLFPVYGDLIVLEDFKLYRVKDCLGAAFCYYDDMMVQVWFSNGFWTGDIV